MISKRSLKVDSSGIRKVFELAAKMQNPVNFSIGQPDFDVPEELKEVAIKAIREGFNRYTLTQGIDELRQKVLEYIEKTRQKKYAPGEVIITSGVSGGLLLALMSIVDAKDEIVFFDPYFVMYKHLVNLLDGKPVIVDTYPDFKISEEKLRKAVTERTKAIILNSPCNPSGYVYTKKDIETVIKVAKEKNILLISDEIYDGFVYDTEFLSPATFYDNTLILGGFSKTYAMTGWRLGYAVGKSELIAQMIKLQQYSFVCAPAPFQYAAVKALEYDTTPFRDAYRRKRDLIYNALKDDFNIVKPGGAFYIFPALKNGDVSRFVELAIKNNVLIIPGNVFSEQNTNFRISYAARDEDIMRGAEILCKLAKEFK
ncbi:MAG: pyridoxal phosphate-dependent aminotransferase [Brevinematia bacterium]